MRMRLGVYVLGAADVAERRLIEAHLSECGYCRAELASLAALPDLLSRVPQEWLARQSPQIDPVAPVERSGVGVGRPFGRAARRAARRAAARIACSWRTVSAAGAALAVGIAAGFWLLPQAAPVPAHQTFFAVDEATHVQASVALTGTPWGTSIQVSADGVPRGELCWLVVHSRTGGTEVDGYWEASGAGPVSVPASAAWQPSDIADVQVVTDSGVLVTIAANPTGPGK